MIVTNQSNPLYDTLIEPFLQYDTLIEPFLQGIDNIKAGFEGKRVEQIFQHAVGDLRAPREIDLTLLDRIGAIAVGIMLLIPLINAVVFAILRENESPLVFERVAASDPVHQDPYPLYVPGGRTPEEIEELYRQHKHNGIDFAPEMPVVPEAAATSEEYIERKRRAVQDLRNYPSAGHSNFECRTEVLQYDLDKALKRYNPTYDPTRLTEFCHFAGVETQREELIASLSKYSRTNINKREEEAKHLLSRLFDFFNKNRALFPVGSEQEGLFKAQIRDTYNRIINAHTSCVDQVLSQLESIVCDVIADVESISGQGAQTMLGRLSNRTALILFKYRANLIRQICITEYPEEHHAADMERIVKQRLAEILAMGGAVINVGAEYSRLIPDVQKRIENIQHIFLFGEASEERIAQDAAAGGENVIAERRRASKYEPEAYLIDALRTYYGAERTLRNDLLIWVRQHFNLTANTPSTTNLIKALSAKPDEFNVEDGGDLTHQGLLYLLVQAGILHYHAPAAV